jgi:dsRNA-specific ribonuclease
MISSIDQKQGIYFGSRGDDFKALITGVLKNAKTRERYIKMLTDSSSMKVYAAAFTSELVDSKNNYQVLEQVGDLTGNKFIVNYMYEKFPQLDCTEGVKVVARLRINYGAKQSFSEIARKLGFWDFISATNDLRQRKMKPLLEDVFEAFLGATERIIDKRKRVGVGYAIVYEILTSIFNEMEISLRYEDLYDAKTRLKELFDMHESSLGPLVYREQKRDMITISTVYRVDKGKYQERQDGTINKKRIIGGQYIRIGEGSAALKSDAQQHAASSAIENLKKQGYFKPVPKIYKMFNKGKDKKNEIISVNILEKTWGKDLNILQETREKTKYQTKYQSTPLSMYCHKRNEEGVDLCLDMKAEPNIADSDGMFSADLLFIGSVDEVKVKNILELLLETGNIKITKAVFDMYYTQYTSEYFKSIIDKFIIS